MWDSASDRFVSKPPQHINHIQLNTDFSPYKIRRNIRIDKSPSKRLSLSQFPPENLNSFTANRSSKRANSIARFIYNDESDSEFHAAESFSPFTYIKTTSIKRVPRHTSSNRYTYNARSTRSTPNRSVRQSPSLRESRFFNRYSELNPFENYLKNV